MGYKGRSGPLRLKAHKNYKKELQLPTYLKYLIGNEGKSRRNYNRSGNKDKSRRNYNGKQNRVKSRRNYNGLVNKGKPRGNQNGKQFRVKSRRKI